MIHIHIGVADDPNPYVVPKEVLCRHIQYFRSALSLNFIEGQTGVLRFPEDNKEAWSLLLYYIFQDRVQPWDGDIIKVKYDTYVLTLVHAYELGDKYSVGRFQNKIMDCMLQDFGGMKLLCDAEFWISKFRITGKGHPLRKFFLQEIVNTVELQKHTKWFEYEELFQINGVYLDILDELRTLRNTKGDYPPHRYGRGTDKVLEEFYVEEE